MRSQQAQVASLCREHLKSRNIHCKVTSKGYSMGDSVKVTIYNQPPHVREEIENEFAKYQYGHFNGMEDIYEYSNRNDDVPQTKFLFVNNEYSQEIKQRAWTFIRSCFSGADQYPESLQDVPTWAKVFDNYTDQVIYQLLSGKDHYSVKFWG